MKGFHFFIFLILGFSMMGQHQEKVDFIRADVTIKPIPLEKRIEGFVVYEFDILQDLDSVFLDAKRMDFLSVNLDGEKIKFNNDNTRISIFKKFKKGQHHALTLKYSCTPKQTVYFSGWDDTIKGNEQIWTQGQGKYTSHWLPSFDAMEEKIEFDLSFNTNKIEDLEIIANGKMTGSKSNHAEGKMVSYDMQKPMSSYLLAFVVGDYAVQELKSASGIPIENYYYPQDSLRVEPTYRFTKEIFDFLQNEIGVAYPWQNYKQIPVHDFLYAGMENTTTTIFSDQYVIDSTAFIDKNYVNVNAHELAHQWFGNLVTEKNGNHHWLHEGFATYYAQLAEKEIFGDDYYFWKLYASLQQLQDGVKRGEGQSLTDPKASSLIFYEKGAWALFALRAQLGEALFKNGIRNYLKKYQFKNVTVTNFLNEMEKVSNMDLSRFREDWLDSNGLPYEEAKNLLSAYSPSIKLLYEMESELEETQSDDIDYQKYWDATNSIYLKKHLIENYEGSFLFDGMKKAFQSNSVVVRQAMIKGAVSNDFLPKEYLMAFLEEESYVTIVTALLQLWQAYPEDRIEYLDKTKTVVGLPNKNVRLLWLTLAMLTEEYNSALTKEYFNELSSYTGQEYSFEVRQGAFFYLKEAFGFNKESLKNLVYATHHHSWQFKKFARNLLDELLKDGDYLLRIQELSQELKGENLRYIQTKLKE